MRRAAAVALGLAILSAACAEPGADGGTSDPTAGAWELESGSLDGEPLPLVDGHPITLSFAEDWAGGTAACNGYGGPYTLSDGELSFGPQAVTEMACMPEAVMESEARYLEALIRVSRFTMEDGHLTLSGGGVELDFVELPPVPTAALVGTTWMLDSLVHGDAVSNVMGDRATLELGADGSVTGSTGCRAFSGRYTISGAEVVLTELAAEGECPGGLQEQDGMVLTVLGDGFGVTIDGDTLTLSSVGGEGLIYKAES